MAYGTGHSVPVWRDYFKSTNLDLFVAEYDERVSLEEFTCELLRIPVLTV